MAQKLKNLTIKNVSRGVRRFFAPLNRYVKPMETVDLLAQCDGNSDIASNIAKSYKGDAGWQVFEVYEGPLPSPEGNLENRSAGSVLADISDAVSEAKEPPREVKEPHKEHKKPVVKKMMKNPTQQELEQSLKKPNETEAFSGDTGTPTQ